MERRERREGVPGLCWLRGAAFLRSAGWRDAPLEPLVPKCSDASELRAAMAVPGRGLARTCLGTNRVFILGEQTCDGGKEHGSTQPSHPAHPHVHRNKPARRLFRCRSATCLASGLASLPPQSPSISPLRKLLQMRELPVTSLCTEPCPDPLPKGPARSQ